MNNEILKIVIQVFGNFHRNHVCVIPCVNLYDQLQLVRRAYLSLVVVIQSFIISLTSSWINLVGCYINTTKRIAKLDRTLKTAHRRIHLVRWSIRNFFPVHSSIFKYPFKLVHRLTRFKSNGDARIGIVETWKGTSRSERYRSRCNFKFLPFRHTLTSHPLPLISVTVMHAVQPPCSVTFICLSSKLASRRARKFEASNGTAQWGHTTYTWNVSAVIATVITVRQFADHCLCNTSINAASCVHTFYLSLSLILSVFLYFSLPLSFPRSFVVCIRGRSKREGKNLTTTLPPSPSKDRRATNMIIPLL